MHQTSHDKPYECQATTIFVENLALDHINFLILGVGGYTT